jgi:hypothetical protein
MKYVRLLQHMHVSLDLELESFHQAYLPTRTAPSLGIKRLSV